MRCAQKRHQRPRTPTDLSHWHLSASATLTLSSLRCLSRTLSNHCVTDMTKNSPGSLFGRCQNRRRPGQHCSALHSTNHRRVGTLLFVLDRLVLLLTYALFFVSSLPYSIIRHPLVSTFIDDITAGPLARRPMPLHPRFQQFPFTQHSYLSVTLKTIQYELAIQDLISDTSHVYKVAHRTHVAHVLAFGASSEFYFLPLFSPLCELSAFFSHSFLSCRLAISSVLPCPHSPSRPRLSLPLFSCVFAPPGLRD